MEKNKALYNSGIISSIILIVISALSTVSRRFNIVFVELDIQRWITILGYTIFSLTLLVSFIYSTKYIRKQSLWKLPTGIFFFVMIFLVNYPQFKIIKLILFAGMILPIIYLGYLKKK